MRTASGHNAPFQRQQNPNVIAMRWRAGLARNLLIRKVGNVCSFTGMLDRQATNVAVLVHIKQRVFIQILSLGYLHGPKLNV